MSATWSPGDSNSAFSFKVSSSLPASSKVSGRSGWVTGVQVWLQCRLGLCSGTTAGASGNILQCLDPAASCGLGAPPHEESALQQVTVRGPLHVLAHPRRGPASGQRGRKEEEEEEEGEESHSPRPSSRTLVEVPVEVAIAISLASFIVGALSTGVLWFLHSRSLRAKSVSKTWPPLLVYVFGSSLCVCYWFLSPCKSLVSLLVYICLWII